MVELKLLRINDAQELTRLYVKNRVNFQRFDPIRGSEFYSEWYQKRIIETALKEKNEYLIGIIIEGKLTGRVSISNIYRGYFQSAYLGYWIDEDFRNKGYTTEAVRKTVRFAFKELNLHRIEADIMTDNFSSLRVIEKCGFERVGLAKNFLFINGKWEDHYIYQIINNADSDIV